MKRFLLILTTIFIFLNNLTSQNKDSVLFKITKLESEKAAYHKYNLWIYNFSDSPICILHSAYINMIGGDPAQRLGLFKKRNGLELYSLHYSERDYLNDYELTNDNFNGEVILPGQKIEVNILVPAKNSTKKILNVDILYLSDFCYRIFRTDIFTNPNRWYTKYKREKHEITLQE